MPGLTNQFFPKIILVLSVSFAAAIAVPIDGYGHGLHLGAPVSYAAPAISYAAPAKILAPAPAYVAAPKVLAAPAIVKHIEPEPYDPNPAYSFSYGVSDHSTGDSKQQEEHLENGVIHGSYSLTEPDGSIRKVSRILLQAICSM